MGNVSKLNTPKTITKSIPKQEKKDSEKKSLVSLNVSQQKSFVVTSEFQKQIDYLHSLIPNDEWSGPLFYRIEDMEGKEIKTIDEFINTQCVIIPIYILPMNKGKGMTTEYEIDNDVMFDLWEKIPETEGARMGHIHTHVGGSTGFSGTDNDQLKSGAFDFDMFVSVIVSKYHDYSCKISLKATQKSVYDCEIPGSKEMRFSGGQEDVVLYFEIPFNYGDTESIDDFFIDQTANIIKEASKTVSYNSNGGVVGFGGSWYNEEDWKDDLPDIAPKGMWDKYPVTFQNKIKGIIHQALVSEISSSHTTTSNRQMISTITYSGNTDKKIENIIGSISEVVSKVYERRNAEGWEIIDGLVSYLKVLRSNCNAQKQKQTVTNLIEGIEDFIIQE